MVEITYKDADGRDQVLRLPPNKVSERRAELLSNGLTVVQVSESYPGEISDAEALEELKNLLPALRKLAANVVPVVAIMLLKLHLVRPDLILYPVSFPVYA